jgi:hypothetical protein
MQLTRGNFVEKILRNADGQLVRVTFALYEHEGRIKARVVEAVVLEEAQAAHVPALIGRAPAPVSSSQVSSRGGIISPFVVSNPLYVSGSQPRAPTK